MSREFIISDTHFHHKLVEGLRGVEARAIIDNINERCKKSDVLWHLGDFAFSKFAPLMDRILPRVRLIPGNHDHRWKWECEPPIVILKNYRVPVVLCHYPLESWPQMHYGALHLHGHCHSGIREMPGRKNLCPEFVGYYPLLLEEVVG